MNTSIFIRASIFPNSGVDISFKQYVEVSLDCSKCSRTHRTVIFGPSDQPGRCTPSGHEFLGQVSAVVTKEKGALFRREIECFFTLTYEYLTVSDLKYPHRASSALPTWGRIHFTTKCPNCGNVSESSVQNNTVRPWTCVCKCGNTLYTEKTEFPIFARAAVDD